MSDLRLFMINLVALWLIGSALSLGAVYSGRDKRDPKTLLLYLYALIFSWAYVGWSTFELLRIIIQAMYNVRLPAQAVQRR